jgi:hypothetical protein
MILEMVCFQVHPVQHFVQWELDQIIYIDPENELVIVARWIEKEQMPEFVRMVLASIKN